MPGTRKPVAPPEKLRRVISRLWLRDLQRSYNEGWLCSEAHLCSELFAQLSKKLSAKNHFHIWVEALLPEFDNLKADLLVTYEQMIIGMIELKYIPHGFPRYENDFLKFEKINLNRDIKVHLKINPASGQPDKHNAFEFDPNCLFVFAAIARYNSDAFHDKTWERLTGNKLMLTGKIDSPEPKLFEVSPEFGKRADER